jgi:hypothetical protein
MVNKKEDMDVLDEVMSSAWLVNAECRLEPLVEHDYYLYKRPDGTSFISLVEPQYWDAERFKGEYLARVQVQASGIWKINEK